MIECALGLGGNIGDVRGNLETTIRLLGDNNNITMRARSKFHQTKPWGDIDQPDFLNACVLIETELSPMALLTAMQTIEKTVGRTPSRRWGPREIDIDILSYGVERFQAENLKIPHPHMFDREFVMMPLREIMSDEYILQLRDLLEAK